ncbi:MAG: serine hydrolase [candidate division WOR-3 bacterium]|nr:MAG: serine hydrolase [candidate division WOR-3 bacterium]
MMRICLLVISVTIMLAGDVVYAGDLHAPWAGSESIQSAQHRSKYLEDMELVECDESPFFSDSAGLHTFIQDACSSYHIPGVATWACKNGQVIWQYCYGYANIDDSIHVVDTTLFMLASISKTFTATAIMQLWERGVFDLDEDINGYLPFGVRNPNYPDSIITFRMLMTHTSSIQDNWTVIDPLYVWGGDSPIPLGSFLEDYLISGGAYYDSAANFHTWPPGSTYDYCNIAVALLGYLVEEMADSFPVYCQDSIFDPLSMNETSWFLAGLDTNNIAVPYHWNGSYYLPYQHYGYPDYPDGQLRTSAPQLARHLMMFMQYGMIDTVRILDSTTVDLMRTIQHQVSPEWFYGLIWYYALVGGRWLWGHGGSDWGVSTVAAFCPAESSAVIVLTNGEAGPGTNMIMHALFDYAQQYGIEEHESSRANVVTLQISPNPFRYATIIRYMIHDSGYRIHDTNIKIFDATGRLVKDFGLLSNQSSVKWDGSDHDNCRLSSGVYFLELQTGDYIATQELLLIR